jgi:cytidylate kinase
VAPLRPADDAVILDTTGNTLEKSISEVYAVVTEHMKGN